jgi:uncharacterized protein YegP (UPF0339 family)
MAAKFEIRSPKAGEFNWVLKSQGRTLATGESYTRKVSAEKAIDSLRKAAAGAAIEDKTVKAPVSKATAKAAAKVKKAATKAPAAAKTAAKRTAKKAQATAKKAAGTAKKAAARPRAATTG